MHLPADPDAHAWWLFPIVLTAGHAGEVAAALAAEGIPARAGYLAEPLHCAPALTANPVYGGSRFPLQVPPASRIPAYGWGHAAER